MLRFNSFRLERYLRSRFVEGKFLLASEATDMELELLDFSRKILRKTMGDVAIGDGWKVERLSSTQLLVKPGTAWTDGIPFEMRGGKDALVSGDNRAAGVIKLLSGSSGSISVSDQSDGDGKIITFNGSITSGNYRISITAIEDIVDASEDLFLQNANLAETTAQKLRLTYLINVVPLIDIDESPLPYTNDVSDGNLVNKIVITPTSGGNGELLATTAVSGAEQIDGRDLELTIRNNPSLGGGNPIPNGVTDQRTFFDGILVDSVGSSYHINAVFNDVISTQVILRIDKEFGQPDPQIINTVPYTIYKKDFIYTEGSTGEPQGKEFYNLANVSWDNATGIVHNESVTDLRVSIQPQETFQYDHKERLELVPTGGGTVSFGVSQNDTLSWTSDITLANAYGINQTLPIAAASVIMDGGSLVYELDLESGGDITRGTQAVTISSISGGGTTINLSALSVIDNIRVGNIIRDSGGVIAEIVQINPGKQLIVDTALVNTGAANIYQDSFGPTTKATLTENSYVFAVRVGGKVYIGGGSLELEDGEENQLGDGITEALLTYIGATDENDSDPNYSSTNIVTQGDPLPDAISDLDSEVQDILDALATPIYDERILYPAGLAALTTIVLPLNSRDGNSVQLYTAAEGLLEVFQNQLYKFQDIDWESVSNNSIRFTYDLPPDTEVHFRIDSISGGSTGGGGGTQSLQDTYNIGDTITTTSGNPITINGPVSEKLLVVNGDMEVTGVIDPTAVEFTPQSSNPLSAGQKGFWVNTTAELMYENGTTPKNFTQTIQNLETGTAIQGLTKIYQNLTGITITQGTPVYSPSIGQIAPAHGNTLAASRVVGVAAEDILDSSSGIVVTSGTVYQVLGFPHGEVLYLTDTPGVLTDVEPTLGPYSSGFYVVAVGLVEDEDLLIRPQSIARL